MERKRAIKVIDDVKFQFQSSIDEVDVDEDCREAYEDNKEVVEALDMAIKLLKQEPCEDAISRQAVHDWIKENTEYDEDHCDYFFVMRSSVMHKDIDELTSVTPKRGQIEWFLVSEGLPKVDGSYRVVQKNGSIGTYVFHKDGNSEEYWKRCVVAWMPSSESLEIESED